MFNHLDFPLSAQDFKGRLAGFKVEVVDTTGAGDSFVAGLLSIVAAHNHIYKVTKILLIQLLASHVIRFPTKIIFLGYENWFYIS